ncbi:MAG: MBL fold metallo-hydrolase [Verrucomicrobia bacterium]|nr:MBL fold metallo-hydrolase [Verrucomicrobiota bacterium]MBV8485862.1 MBL fold metallo-hydrolase [Verrucomicrobiota bacterium]
MPKFLCTTCGVQYPESPVQPSRCVICDDPRQFVPKTGQGWTTSEKLGVDHFNAFRKIGNDLFAFSTVPRFGIGQRAFLIITPSGNVLWDCVSFLDGATIDIIRLLGGLKAIAVSHPHFYSTVSTWGRTFECPVFLHEADKEWLFDPDPCISFWTGETKDILPGITIHRLGGHFPGSTVLHWIDRQALFPGDTILVTFDRKHVSFMWSYPNNVPLPAADVERIGSRLRKLEFDSIYSPFWERGEIERDAKEAVEQSVIRQVKGPEAAK